MLAHRPVISPLFKAATRMEIDMLFTHIPPIFSSLSIFPNLTVLAGLVQTLHVYIFLKCNAQNWIESIPSTSHSMKLLLHTHAISVSIFMS